MDFSIVTERLILRDFRATDWEEVHSYAADPEVVRFMNWGPNTPSDTQNFIAQAMRLAQEEPRRSYQVAVVAKATERVLGGAALKMLERDPLSGELGYTLHPSAWGQGYGTELARAILAFGFRDLGLDRIWASCRPENLGSRRILKKVGLGFEQYLQNERVVRGAPVDTLIFAATRAEWLS